jgi:hypothetical protein
MPIPHRPALQSPHTAEKFAEWRQRIFPICLDLWAGGECVTIGLDSGGRAHYEFGMVSYELGPEADRAGLTAVAEQTFERAVLRFADGREMTLEGARVVYGDYSPDYVALVEDEKYERQREGIRDLHEFLAQQRRERPEGKP